MKLDEDELIKLVTLVVREADIRFISIGGTSRHWVADAFLPLLRKAGLEIVRKGKKR